MSIAQHLTPREAITLSLTEGREAHTSLPGALQPLAVLCDDYHSCEGVTVFTGTHEGRPWCVNLVVDAAVFA